MLNAFRVGLQRTATRHIAIRVGVCAVAVLPFLAPLTARASFVNTLESATYATDRFTTTLPTVCPAYQSSSGLLSCDVVDPVFQVESFETAYGAANGVHATAHTTFAMSHSASVINSAYSQLNDTFAFTGPLPAQIVAIVTETVLGNNNSETFLDLTAPSASFGGGCAGLVSGVCSAYETFSPASGFSLQLYAVAIALVGPTFNEEEGNVDAYISSLTFTDLAGNPLSVFYTSRSGTVYPPAIAPVSVSEPATGALVIPFALLGFALRRRTRPHRG